ncbi:MOS1T transposase, partial [Pseudoatta argentina]
YEPNSRHLREILIFCFNMKKSTAEAHRMLPTYGEAAISERTCREWFQRFKNGDFDVEDRHSGGREKVFEDAKLEALLDQDSCQNQEELARSLGMTQPAISKRLNVIDAFEPSIERQTVAIQERHYSPDVAPSDYLFRSIAHGLADQHFRSYEEVKNWIDSWIASKDDQFFRRGIRTLPERWEKVVASDGQYFES